MERKSKKQSETANQSPSHPKSSESQAKKPTLGKRPSETRRQSSHGEEGSSAEAKPVVKKSVGKTTSQRQVQQTPPRKQDQQQRPNSKPEAPAIKRKKLKDAKEQPSHSQRQQQRDPEASPTKQKLEQPPRALVFMKSSEPEIEAKLTGLKCDICTQSCTAPYETANLTDFRLQNHFQFMVCPGCLRQTHFGCQYKGFVAKEYKTLDILGQTVILSHCGVCQSHKSVDCAACGLEQGKHQMQDIEIDGLRAQVHTVCTLWLPSLFRIDESEELSCLKEELRRPQISQCSLCHKVPGYKVHCAEEGCAKEAHPTCAQGLWRQLFHQEMNKSYQTSQLSYCEEHVPAVQCSCTAGQPLVDENEENVEMQEHCKHCCIVFAENTCDFKCQMCRETERSVDQSQALFTESPDLLTIDRRSLRAQFIRAPLEGFTTYLQLKLQTRVWITITSRLQELLTTQTLLEQHFTQKHHFTTNVVLLENYLNELKFQQASLLDSIFKRQVTDTQLAKRAASDSVEANMQSQDACQNFIDSIKKSSHLQGDTEFVYIVYRQREQLLIAERLTQQKSNLKDVTQCLHNLECLKMQDKQAFANLSKIRDGYQEWRSTIIQRFYQSPQTYDQLLSDVFQLKQQTSDPLDLMQLRYLALKQIFEGIPTHDSLTELIAQNPTGINEQPLLEELDATLIPFKPTAILASSKPIRQLLQTLCKLATQQPCLTKVQTDLLDAYRRSVEWQVKARALSHSKDQWEHHAIDAIQSGDHLQAQADLCSQEGIYADGELVRLTRLRERYEAFLLRQSEEILEAGTDIDLATLEDFCYQCRSVGLTSQVTSVQKKIDLMSKVLKVLEKEFNTEEKLQHLMTEVMAAKMQQINIPYEMEMALETKVQIIEELRRDFNKVLAGCADFFDEKSVAELRKIQSRAQNRHQVLMEKEKKIVESLAKSEAWFENAFTELTAKCNKQLHEIDFKNFAQLQTVLKSQRDCEQLLKLPPNIKPENLVAAARNLYQSLQGAKWIFEVRSLMQGGGSDNQPTRELSHLLMLYYKAKELNINFELMQPHDAAFSLMITEFEQLAKIAEDFDNLFGTHQKIIATLEKYETTMGTLISTVDHMQQRLLTIKDSTHCQISPAVELDTLQKVRSYVTLNEDYQVFIQAQRCKSAESELSQEGCEIDASLFREGKISYQKALKLQSQARESQIPEDIPVLRKLNQSILKYEKFVRECTDYQRFCEKIKLKRLAFVKEIQASMLTDSQAQLDASFTLKFVKRLLEDASTLEIEVSADTFNPRKVAAALSKYEVWKTGAESVLKRLEGELSRKSELQLSGDLIDRFYQLSTEVSDCPVYNHELFLKIQAYDWVYTVCKLLCGKYEAEEQQTLNLTFWKNTFDQQEALQDALPFMRDHPIVQRILWELDQARTISEFVKSCKNTQRHLAGKFVQQQRGPGADNYIVFKNKTSREKFNRFIEQADRCQIDITSEKKDLQTWAQMHDRYLALLREGTLWEQGYEKVLTIQRNIYQSPIDISQLYFQIEQRLDTAQEIRTELKRLFEEASTKEKRIKVSKVQTTLKHFKKNCKITGIPEVERLQRQIAQSQSQLAEAERLVESSECDLSKVRSIVLNLIPIDLESDEIPVRKEIFQKTVAQLQTIPFSQFRLLEKDYLKLKYQISKVGLQFVNNQFEELRRSVDAVVQQLKAGKIPNADQLPAQVDFSIAIADKRASLNAVQREAAPVESSSSSSDSSSDSSSANESVEDQESAEAEQEQSNSIAGDNESDVEMVAGEAGEDEMSEMSEAEPESIAVNRQRREIKSYQMDDHIYYVKQPLPSEAPPKRYVTKSQLRAKREAKQAAKDFQKQKQKASAQQQKKPLQLHDDLQVQDTLEQMKTKIRAQTSTQLQTYLKKHQFLAGDRVSTLAQEIEETLAKKYPQLDQQYRARVTDVCRNLESLKAHPEICEPMLQKGVGKVMQSSINFQEVLQKAVNARKAEQRKIQMQQQISQRQNHPQPSCFHPGSNPQHTFDLMRQAAHPLRAAMAPRPPVPTLLQQASRVPLIVDLQQRRDSVDSVQSLQSNPAQFSDDEGVGGYDPFQTTTTVAKPQTSSFGIKQSYNPRWSITQQQFSQQSRPLQQKEKILYDPIAHGNQPLQPQQLRLTLSRPGSLLKVYEGCLDTGKKDAQFSVTLMSFQDVRLYQKLVQPPATLTLKGELNFKAVCDHFLKIQTDPHSSGQLLKGYAQRTSHLHGEQSDLYQQFFDNFEQSQKVAIFNLLEGVTIYFVPISKTTREFVKQMGISTDSSHLQSFAGNAKKIDFDQETHLYAWVSHVRQTFAVRSNSIWNPTVLKNLPSETSQQAPPQQQQQQHQQQQVKYASPVTSEEASFESAKQRKKIEINLIQAADSASSLVKSEASSELQQHIKTISDDDEIDSLILEYRLKGGTDIVAKIEQLIQKSNAGNQSSKQEKLEAFLKEVIASKQGSQDMVKQEQLVFVGQQRGSQLMHDPFMGSSATAQPLMASGMYQHHYYPTPQQQGYAPPLQMLDQYTGSGNNFSSSGYQYPPSMPMMGGYPVGIRPPPPTLGQAQPQYLQGMHYQPPPQGRPPIQAGFPPGQPPMIRPLQPPGQQQHQHQPQHYLPGQGYYGLHQHQRPNNQ